MDHQPVSAIGHDADLCECDRDEFVRVWQRVNPEPKPDSPISLYIPPTSEAHAPSEALAVPALPALPMQTVPAPEEPPCFGRGAAEYAPLLKNMILCELGNMRIYQTMKRRTDGPCARILSELADDAAKRAKSLSTAYFLITGTEYWPADRIPNPRLKGSHRGILRECFLRAQKTKAQCLIMAERSSDPCLQTLCRDTAADKQAHLHLLQSAMEHYL